MPIGRSVAKLIQKCFFEVRLKILKWPPTKEAPVEKFTIHRKASSSSMPNKTGTPGEFRA